MGALGFKVHAVIQMDERGLTIEDVRMAPDNGEDIEARPTSSPTMLVSSLGLCELGALHVAVRDNIGDDEIIVETAYQPDPALREPDFKTPQEEPMTCIVCHHGETQPGTTTVTFHRDGQAVVVKVLEIAARKAQVQVRVRDFAPAA